jgi:Tol biopolymer transport system component
VAIRPGTHLGPYEIVAPLGAGGFGEVYKARDPRLNRTVALKILPHTTPERALRFQREAKAIAALQHPHICTLYDVGRQEDHEYLVLEYLEGETLADRLLRGALNLDEALMTAIDIADALDAAHRVGIVHRDLKPANIILSKTGVKLLDFGLAKLHEPPLEELSTAATAAAPPLTSEGTILGTLHYMSPEQLEAKEADPRSDIWAFGAVLYEMLTGKRAFEAQTAASLINAIMSGSPRSMTEITALSPVLDAIVRTCLAKDPDRRFQSIRDVAIALEWVRGGVGSTAPRATRRLSPALLVGVLALLTAIAAAAGVLVWQRNESGRRLSVLRFEITEPEGQNFASTPALSPDSSQIAFVATDTNGTSRLWLRRFDEDDARAISGTEGAAFPFWSFDGRSLGFFATGKLKRVDVDGGAPVAIADAPTGRGGAWREDDTIIFAPTSAGGLARVNANGGTVAVVTTLADGAQSHRMPFPLSDDRFGYFAMNQDASKNGVWIAALRSSAAPMQLLHTDDAAQFAAGFLFFVRDETLLAQRFDAVKGVLTGTPIPVADNVASSGSGTTGVPFLSISRDGSVAVRRSRPAVTQLTWIARDGRAIESLNVPPGAIDQPELSPDGSRLAYLRNERGAVRSGELWILDLARGSTTLVQTSGPGVLLPLWFRDGSRLVVTSPRGPGGNNNLYAVSVDGGALTPVVEAAAGLTGVGWSGDDLCYAHTDPPVTTLKILAPDGQRRNYFTPGAGMGSSRVSPDGRWIAYVSERSGRADVYLIGYPAAGTVRQVSVNGGSQPRWRKDSRELFYLASDRRLMAVSVKSDGGRLDLGVPSPLVAVRTIPGTRYHYDVAPDGQRFIVAVEQRPQVDSLNIIRDWAPHRSSMR